MRNLLMCGVAVLLLAPAGLQADEREVTVPEGSKFFLHLDLRAFQQTRLGGRLFEMARREAMRELDKGDKHNEFEKMKEMLGFDPFDELDSLTVVGLSLEEPQKRVQLVLTFKKTTGNLEELARDLPGHNSTEYEGHTIHSAQDDDDHRIFAAIHADRNGRKRMVAARSLNDVRKMLDTLDGVSRSESKAVKLALKDSSLVHIELLEMPKAPRGPHAMAAKMLERVSLKIASVDNDMQMSLTLRTAKEKDAQRVRQMVQGLIAMAQMIEDADDELKQAQEFLEQIEVKRKGREVRIRIAVPEADLIDMIEQEMDLQLSELDSL